MVRILMCCWCGTLLCLLSANERLVGAERNLLDVRNRFLDGSIDASKAKQKPSVFPIDSFEDREAFQRDWSFQGARGELANLHATDGNQSLKVTFQGKGAVAAYRRGSGGFGNPETDRLALWSAQVIFNDEARLDVYNAEDRKVTLLVTMGKPFRFELKPGANALVMKTREMVDFAYRSTTILPTTRLAVEDDKPVTLYLDHFRWVGPGLGENLIAHARCFDASPSADEWGRPYFLPLSSNTAYAKKRGYGWENPSDVEFSYDLPKMRIVGGTGRQPHDTLIRHVLMGIQSPLLVDLPDGEYRVHWVEGHIFAFPGLSLACEYDLSLKVGDQVVPVRRAARGFAERARYMYGRDRVDYLPGEDRWRKYMSDLFSPQEADVQVSGGQLKLEFLTNPPGRANLNFLIIYPVAKAPLIEPELAAMWHDLRYRFNEMSFQQATPDLAQAMNLPGLHAEFLDPNTAARRRRTLSDQLAGDSPFVAFRREATDDVYPDTVPALADVCDNFRSFGPPGEIATFAINLHALADLPDLKFELKRFRSARDATIPHQACDVRFARYSYRMSGQQSHGDWKYMVLPWFLVRRDSTEVCKGMSVRWWVNVDVPADTAPGEYLAQATVSAKGVEPRTLTMRLNVLPLRLDPVPNDVEFSTQWGVRQEFAPSPDGGFGGVGLRMEPKLAKEWAQVLRDRMVERTAAELKLMKRYGLNLVYHRTDLKETSVISLDLPPEVTRILPLVEPRENSKCYLAGAKSGGLESLTADKVASLGKKTILFGPPKGYAACQQESGIYRFCSGLFLWRLGASGCLYDPWRSDWGDPYHPFDNHCGEWGSLCVPASEGWPTLNSSVVLEGIREGILDYRYLITLERLVIEKARHPVAKEAQDYMRKLKERIRPEGTYYFVLVGQKGGWDGTWHQKDTCWNGKEYAEVREQLANFVARLQKQEP